LSVRHFVVFHLQKSFNRQGSEMKHTSLTRASAVCSEVPINIHRTRTTCGVSASKGPAVCGAASISQGHAELDTFSADALAFSRHNHAGGVRIVRDAGS